MAKSRSSPLRLFILKMQSSRLCKVTRFFIFANLIFEGAPAIAKHPQMQHRSGFQGSAGGLLPFLQAGSRSSVEIYRSDPYFDTHGPILPFITGALPSLDKNSRPCRMYYRAGAKSYYLYSIKSNGALSPTTMKHLPLG